MFFLHQSRCDGPTLLPLFLGISLYLKRVAGRCPKTWWLGSFFSYDLFWFWGLLLKTSSEFAFDVQSVKQNQILFTRINIFHPYFNPVSVGSMALAVMPANHFLWRLEFPSHSKDNKASHPVMFSYIFVRCIPIFFIIIIPNAKNLGSITPNNNKSPGYFLWLIWLCFCWAATSWSELEGTHHPWPRSMLPPLIEANDTQGSRKVSGNVPSSEQRPFSDDPPENDLMPFI